LARTARKLQVEFELGNKDEYPVLENERSLDVIPFHVFAVADLPD
jgi:hypothetical protein